MGIPRRLLRFESLESRRVLAAVDIPDNLTGQAGADVTVPVNIDNALGVRGAEIRLDYDTNVLDITQSNITAGSVWAGDATVDVVANVDEAAGTIVVSVFGAQSLPASSGSLVQLKFTVRSGVTANTSTAIDLNEVSLNEGAITVSPSPQPGTDTTDGTITISPSTGNATISGTVYADVNNNNAPDATEGLPGITITLVNSTTNQQVQTTTTQNDGKYQFTGVAPGSYFIRETQPAAYLDGSGNEISAQLSAGQNLTGQDFRERGLRPAFVYNRLFTTLVMPIGSANWAAALAQIHTDAQSAVANPLVITTTSSNSPASSSAEGEGSSQSDTQLASSTSATSLAMLEGEGEGFTDGPIPITSSLAEGESCDTDIQPAPLFAGLIADPPTLLSTQQEKTTPEKSECLLENSPVLQFPVSQEILADSDIKDSQNTNAQNPAKELAALDEFFADLASQALVAD